MINKIDIFNSLKELMNNRENDTYSKENMDNIYNTYITYITKNNLNNPYDIDNFIKHTPELKDVMLFVDKIFDFDNMDQTAIDKLFLYKEDLVMFKCILSILIDTDLNGIDSTKLCELFNKYNLNKSNYIYNIDNNLFTFAFDVNLLYNDKKPEESIITWEYMTPFKKSLLDFKLEISIKDVLQYKSDHDRFLIYLNKNIINYMLAIIISDSIIYHNDYNDFRSMHTNVINSLNKYKDYMEIDELETIKLNDSYENPYILYNKNKNEILNIDQLKQINELLNNLDNDVANLLSMISDE